MRHFEIRTFYISQLNPVAVLLNDLDVYHHKWLVSTKIILYRQNKWARSFNSLDLSIISMVHEELVEEMVIPY